MTLLLALVAAALAPPAATTEPPRDVTRTSATLVATVDPNGEPTTVRFDFGTTTAYGLESAVRTVDGDEPVEVTVPVTGLTADTTYHARVRATNASGQDLGADRSFRTTGNPRPPGASTGSARAVAATTATAVATVDPNGSATTVRFQFGRTTSYGATTPAQTIGAEDRPREVTAALRGLRANTTYNVRVIAQNAAGVVRGRNRTFRTDRGLTGATATVDRTVAVWGEPVTVTGRLAGASVRGAGMALEAQELPFDGPFGQIGATRTAERDGTQRFTLPLFRTIRLRVASRPVGIASPPLTVLVRPMVGMRIGRAARSRLRFSGAIWPQLPAAVVSVQRRSASGRWVPVRRGPTVGAGDRSRYGIEVRRPRRPSVWRVVVLPNAGGAYVRGLSRERATR